MKRSMGPTIILDSEIRRSYSLDVLEPESEAALASFGDRDVELESRFEVRAGGASRIR